MPTSYPQDDPRDHFTILNLRTTGLFHPLGPELFFIPLTRTSKNPPGMYSQLIRLSSGWVLITLEIQPVQNRNLQPPLEHSIEALDEARAQQLAKNEGQEALFLWINENS